MSKGFYIVLEGAQGTGKTSQLEMISADLTKMGYSVRLFREPDNQHHFTARAIRRLTQDPQYPLNTRAEVLLYNAARALSLDNIREAIANGVICIADRNYLTTLAIQYYARGDVEEYSTINEIIEFAIGDMEPDLTLVLDAPGNVLAERTQKRAKGERFDNLDVDFINKIRRGYLSEAKKRDYILINANQPKSSVYKEIKQRVNALIDGKYKYAKPSYVHPKQSQNNSLTIPADYITKNNEDITITKNGKARLGTVITSVESDVYSFIRGGLDEVTISAAMARLSRRGDDMRITLLDEFIDKEGKDEGLIHRVVTAYGDDSVQQLVGVHLVVENASNLLTKQIEWGRLAAYLEQSTRYIYYDKKDKDGNFKYYVPPILKNHVQKEYKQKMDIMFSNYSEVVHHLTDFLTKTNSTPSGERDAAWKGAIRAQACDAARHMLPVATKSTVGIFGSAQAIESMVMRLMAEESQEARDCGKAILKEARKVTPAFFERADKPERGGATIAYRSNTKKAVNKLSSKLLPKNYSLPPESVNLTDCYPKNEVELAAHMIYETSTLSEFDLKELLNSINYQDKVNIMQTYFGERLNRRHRPGRALERAFYSFDILCDYGIFRDLQRHRIVNDLTWQQLTPRYGYDIPELIEKAGMTDLFIENFDISLALHSRLVEQGYDLEAQYATLMGHKMRWKITMNAREAFHFMELRTAPQGHPGYRKLVKQMYDKLAEVHPVIASAMIFVNKDEDPELTRLAAERYTQYKLNNL